MKFNDDEDYIKRNAGIIKTIAFFLVAITVIFILLIYTVISIFSIYNIKYLKTYYILDINNKNKNTIVNLLEQEKDNIFPNTKLYCESMYKIEYYYGFPDGTNYTIYCKDEENINFSIDKVGEDVIKSYIYEKGYTKLK